MDDENRFNSYNLGEFVTGGGQIVDIAWSNQELDKEELARILGSIKTIKSAVTGAVQVPHGGYGQYTRYQVVQHDYTGSIDGYAEVLEIKDPPDGRHGIVINQQSVYHGKDCCFVEFDTVGQAITAFSNFQKSFKHWDKQPGFKRLVVCDALNPWFYAIGEQQLIGDYAFPEGMQQDLVYRCGRKFVVYNNNDVPEIKTCVGSRFVKKITNEHSRQIDLSYRLVFWSDGTFWNEGGYSSHNKVPRPIEAGEEWIVEAINQFQRLLAGDLAEFTINLTNDTKFVGKLKTDRSIPSVEGNYLLSVRIEGEEKLREGWMEFRPTTEAPNIVKLITQQCEERGKRVASIEIKEYKTKMGGKKWHGVYFNPAPR